jgi:hypothetical protein
LTYCATQFIEKDPELASLVIIGLLRYWPITNCQKEVMFLSEIEEILIIGLLRYWPITNCQKEVMFLSEIEEILDATS